MKNVIDLFIAKDRTAMFWFVLACAAILCSGIYVKTIVGHLATKPQYVMMDGNGIYYLAPSVEFDEADELHVAQTKLAMETIYTRGQRGIVHQDRTELLFTKKARKQLDEEFGKDSKTFRDKDIHQTISIGEVRVLGTDKLMSVATGVDPHTARLTYAEGTLTRVQTYEGKTETEDLTVSANFIWIINPTMSDKRTGPFPSLCAFVKLADPKKLEE